MRLLLRHFIWSWHPCYTSRLPGLEGTVRWFEDLIADATLQTTLSAADVPERDLPMPAADAMLQQRFYEQSGRGR